ncbi:lantibiotic dehydratase family protein [Sinosporangium album]|nr:lantibiotic dehydratase family protein [Sinosporangium album]
MRSGAAMLRASVNLTGPNLPAWPGPDGTGEDWRTWIDRAWADRSFRRAVSSASPELARQVGVIVSGRPLKLRRMQRAALSVARYANRYVHRSTPFGWFAGVGLVEFGAGAFVRFGEGHEVCARVDPAELDGWLSERESDAVVMSDVDVCVNNLARVEGNRVFVPSEGDSRFSLALTSAVALVLKTAVAPIGCSVLVDKLSAEFPGVSEERSGALVRELLRVRLLRSAMRAAATVTDPSAGVPALTQTTAGTVDVRLDARVRLPETVSIEIETAATALARLATYPAGTAAWRRYIERFEERYGEGAEVELDRLVDPVSGLGLPDGFGQVEEPPRPMSRRDRLLLELAGTAAVEGRRSMILTEEMIEELEAAAGGPALVPAPHLELCAQVQSRSLAALDAGDFRVRVLTVSRAAGTMTGRFWHLFPEAASEYATLPTVDPQASLAQLSFHPARVGADLLARAPQVLPKIVSVGEFRHVGPDVHFASDLSVGLRAGHLYLTVTETGDRLELLTPTAINFVWNSFTPPLVRFLAEISRAATPQVTWFDWGAAWTLPFTPALHYRRSVLAAARWQLRARVLPDRTAPLERWVERLHTWRLGVGAPERVLLALDDQHLHLNLTLNLDLDLLRSHLSASRTAILHEAPPLDANGWIGGRAHSVVLPMRSSR